MLYLMRHGKTDWNAIKKIQGQSDIPLNEEGRRSAREAREANADLSFDICFCSTLVRAKETAAIFLEGKETPVVYDERLQEMGFGIYEGFEHVFEHPECPLYTLFQDPAGYRAEGGAESLEELRARTDAVLEERILPEVNNGKNVLITAHGGVGASILSRFRNTPTERFWEDNLIGNCELVRIL